MSDNRNLSGRSGLRLTILWKPCDCKVIQEEDLASPSSRLKVQAGRFIVFLKHLEQHTTWARTRTSVRTGGVKMAEMLLRICKPCSGLLTVSWKRRSFSLSAQVWVRGFWRHVISTVLAFSQPERRCHATPPGLTFLLV